MNVGTGALFPVPDQKMGTAYTAMAPSMVTVSDTLQQSEYATDVRGPVLAPDTYARHVLRAHGLL
jgi:hypothetical protein